MFRTTGQVLGVALSACLTQSILTRELNKGITGPGADEVSPFDPAKIPRQWSETDIAPFQIISKIRHSTSSIPHLPPPLRAIAITSYSTALRSVFWAQVIVGVCAVGACLGMREVDLEVGSRGGGKGMGAGEEGREERDEGRV